MGSFLSTHVRKFRSSKKVCNPLPRERRALSVSQNPSNAGLFGRLPFEIRHAIYVYALGGDLVHLTHTFPLKEMGYHACQWSDPYSHHYHTAGEPGPRNRICLLKTCRQIYIEALPVLYSTNTFGLFGAHNLSVFCDFSRTTRKDRLDSIASIHIKCEMDGLVSDVFLQEWKQTWEILATQMPGLKDLKVHLTKLYFPQLGLALDEDWVKPMLKVRGLKKFEFDLAQGIGSDESTAVYNEKLEWFQKELYASTCAPR